jgi:peptide/nickel transport system permease protein
MRVTPALGIGIAIVLLIAIVALASLLPFTRYDAVTTNLADRLLAPGTATSTGQTAWLGTDQVGRDLLRQMMAGARVSLIVGLGTVLLAGILGTFLGFLAGFVGGRLGRLVMQLVDIQLAFPGILLAILIASILGPTVWNVIVTLSITRWVAFARIARSIALECKHLAYVEFASFSGASTAYIMRRHILPNAMTSIVVLATVEFGHAIVAEAALSFLGLGVSADTASWGWTIATGRDYLYNAWWISTFAGIALSLLMIGIGLIGDELRQRLDPRAN